MKKCPPGVICVENITMFLLLIILLVLMIFVYMNSNKDVNVQEITIKNNRDGEPRVKGGGGFLASWPYTNQIGDVFFQPKDVLRNPYSAPYSDERYVLRSPELVPINVSTNSGAVSKDTAYRQMGMMTPLNSDSKDNILPLMGRPLFTNRNKWQYYAISNQHNNVKLPISFKGKSALNDYGVDEIFNGDTVYVEGYNSPFKVIIYDNDTIKYLPFI